MDNMNIQTHAARNFLKVTKSSLTIEYYDYNYHFEGDKDKRDVYNVVLKRGNRKYAFKFGQSIACSGYFLTVFSTGRAAQVFDGDDRFIFTDKKPKAKKFRTVVKKIDNAEKWISTTDSCRDYFYELGSRWDCFRKLPSAYSVLACMVTNDPGTFEEFCLDYGYSDDSIKALKIYNGVVDEFKSLRTLYSDDELCMLGEIV
jgi:hypothetical protein